MRRSLALLVAPALAVAASLELNLASSNTVPPGRLGESSRVTTVDARKPLPDCASITVTSLVIGTNGTVAANLLLGSAAAESLDGKNGSDCIVGGGGNDSLNGGPGTDVCIGGPGVDTFTACETSIQ